MSREAAPAPDSRRLMIAKIHLAKKALALEEDSYRAILLRVGGADSSGKMTVSQLDRVLQEFRRLGWQGPKGKPRSGTGRKASGKSWVRKVWAIWGDLKPLLDDGDDAALFGFVKRQTGIDNPEWLSPAQANKVIAGLQGWLARKRGEASV